MSTEKQNVVRKLKKKSFDIEHVNRLNQFELDQWQKEMQNVIRENTITFVDSFASTGKTFCALHYAAQQYLTDPTCKITIVRTPVEAGDDKIGALPGDASTSMEGKLGVHFASTKAILNDLLGAGRVDCDEGKRIFFTIPNFVLGATIDGVLIADECQMLSPLTLKLILERLGEGGKCIILGASGQIYEDSKKRNGLRDALKRFFNEDGSKKYNKIGRYTFPLEAVKRDDVVRDVITAYGIG